MYKLQTLIHSWDVATLTKGPRSHNVTNRLTHSSHRQCTSIGRKKHVLHSLLSFPTIQQKNQWLLKIFKAFTQTWPVSITSFGVFRICPDGVSFCSTGGVGRFDGVLLLSSLLLSLLMLDGISWLMSDNWSVWSFPDAIGSPGDSSSVERVRSH